MQHTNEKSNKQCSPFGLQLEPTHRNFNFFLYILNVRSLPQKLTYVKLEHVLQAWCPSWC